LLTQHLFGIEKNSRMTFPRQISAQQLRLGIFVLLLVCGAVVRLFNLSETAQFLGDQGRDALIISRIFLERDLVFIGPVTSVGNMYLGPLYYYLMAPFLFLSYPSPLGPAYAVAVMSIAAVALMHLWGRRLIGRTGALIAMVLVAFSAPIVEYSRFSWNPNPVPLVMIGLLYVTYLAWQKNSRYWILVCILLGVIIQLHYLTLVLFAGAGIVWLIATKQAQQRKKLTQHLGSSAAGAAAFFLLLSPLILFDLKHQGLNARAFLEIFTSEKSFTHEGGVLQMLATFGSDFGTQLHRVLFELSWGISGQFGALAVLGIVLCAGYLYFKKELKHKKAITILAIYLLTSAVGISLYTHQIFDHYILFFIPVTALLFGWMLSYVWKVHFAGKLSVISILVWYAVSQLQIMPLVGTTMTVREYKQASEEISQHIQKGEVYAVVLLSGTGDLYGQNYRYFLSTEPGKKPVNSEETIEVDTLVVINEERLPDPLTLPIYQIQIFPDKEQVQTVTLSSGIEVYILRKNVPNSIE
jgi:4-amino-4-deoxy-L-arabinose transferase-like glycosyltransferase